ncbi:RNA polymerase sigma factor [Paenibacillus sp. F411]|uniref:RNA polymerase sigma factor n=1 Tax=Paenibacillus sp. F411 TaxID=2820239 RepID=UPI001AAECD0E|nr:RNA polymerase sigma factor [Paenibacillus sp. F411]MBO2944395.1 RNA polymerase sigma factor [Paenibacillus sp. F411]
MTDRELFDAYNKDVYRTCYYMLRNVQDAEDVCHDVFVTVFRQDWHEIEQLRAWILRISVNHCLNLLRKQQRRTVKQPQLQWMRKHQEASVPAVDAQVLKRESSEEWEKLLGQLPEKLMAVVVLRYLGELSTAEIAQSLNLPQGTVKSRLHKALKLMRGKLESKELYDRRGERQYGAP